MSLAGLVAQRGATVTIRRGTVAVGTMGGTSRTWADAATGVHVWLNELSRHEAQRMWGQETKATHEGVALATEDVVAGDGLVVTLGPYLGQRFRVVSIAHPATGPEHLHLELQRAQAGEL